MIQIIPAIDIIQGQCVRLTQGDYKRVRIYPKNPLELAKEYQDIGITRLHIVDLEGAKNDCPVNLNILEKISNQTALSVQWGGGIKTHQSLRDVFNAGATYAICGSIAVKNKNLFAEWLSSFGKEKIILGADTKQGYIAISGWEENTKIATVDLITSFREQLKYVICTDIERDGMLNGPNIELYQTLQMNFNNIEIIASGGISSIKDIEQLDSANIKSVIVGKAIYEAHITLKDLKSII